MELPIAEALETATWGLVVATALLAIAAGIPALTSLAHLLAERRQRVAEVIPDLHMLRGRLNQQIGWLGTDSSSSTAVIGEYADNARDLLGIVARLLELAPAHGLKFTNEVYVCRHLLSLALYEIEGAVDEAHRDSDDQEFALVASSSLVRAVRLNVAAKTTLSEAEQLLPAKVNTIDGEGFWDRFSRVSHEREDKAEQQLMRDRGK
jgi:hypothetical protein